MARRIRKMLTGCFSVLIAAMLGIPAVSAAEYEPLPIADVAEVDGRFYQNPLGVIDIGDPFILTEDSNYHVFATGGPIGFNVWSTEDFDTFGKQKALKKLSWVSGNYWAPEVYAYDGQYVMLYTARRREDESLRIGIAFSEKPEGPYEDPLDGPLFDLGYAAIDAALFVEDDIPYLYYVRDCSENIVDGIHESHIYGVRLSPDLMSFEGDPVLLTVPDQDWELESTGDFLWNEGPSVIAHDGKYYLYYSAHYFEDKRYGVGVAVADDPLGPYVKQENNPLLWYIENDEKVLVSGPGHNSFFSAGDELFTAYHTHTYPLAPSGNRQLNIDRAGFHADGTAFIDGPRRVNKLLPLVINGLVNHAPQAVGEDTELLTDGDTCAATTSADYIWRGKSFSLEWDSPREADMLVIYLAEESSATGHLTINDQYRAEIDFGTVEDGVLVLHFPAMEIESLDAEWDAEAALGEIYVIGSES